MRRLMLLPLVFATACAAKQVPEAGDQTLPTEHCDATKAQFAKGQTDTPELGEKARKAAGAKTLRRLHPGEIVAMIYMFGRLNFELDAEGKIKAVRCG